MAISLTEAQLLKDFNPQRWASPGEFITFKLQYIGETRGDTLYYTNGAGIETKLPPVNHFPDLKEYEVWAEGYQATGESGGAILMGIALARNFAEACHKVMCQNYLDSIVESEKDPNKQYALGRWDYDPTRLSYWGCKLYWDQQHAAKSFG